MCYQMQAIPCTKGQDLKLAGYWEINIIFQLRELPSLACFFYQPWSAKKKMLEMGLYLDEPVSEKSIQNMGDDN